MQLRTILALCITVSGIQVFSGHVKISFAICTHTFSTNTLDNDLWHTELGLPNHYYFLERSIQIDESHNYILTLTMVIRSMISVAKTTVVFAADVTESIAALSSVTACSRVSASDVAMAISFAESAALALRAVALDSISSDLVFS